MWKTRPDERRTFLSDDADPSRFDCRLFHSIRGEFELKVMFWVMTRMIFLTNYNQQKVSGASHNISSFVFLTFWPQEPIQGQFNPEKLIAKFRATLGEQYVVQLKRSHQLHNKK